MMAVSYLLILSLLSANAAASARGLDRNNDEAQINPIRRVVTMLQSMQAKIAKEAKSEEELYDKYMCYCKTGAADLTLSIESADTKIPQVESAIEEAENTKVQLEQEIKDHQSSRADAKKAMAEATALREKEAASYAKESGDLKTNIDALTGAIGAIEKGMAGFLQTNTARIIRKLSIDSGDLSDFDRQRLAAFLSGAADADEGYVPKSGEITGILKEMKDSMSKDLADCTADEESAVKSYEDLMAAKKKEVDANTAAIEKKTVRVGNLGVEIAQMKNDLDDTQAALLEDKKFLADMDKNCASKKAEWEETTKLRNQELIALADTIKILNDDDALELFKKTLPTPSFVQIATRSRRVQQKALSVVQEARTAVRPRNRAALDLIALALTGKKVNFDKVIKLIDELVETLKKEQFDDDAKKETCEKQIDFTEDKVKGLAHDISDLETAIEDATEKLATTTQEIKDLGKAIAALDKEVMEMTETRKEEHEEYTELMASDAAAKELIGMAKNRLNKFYNPKLYQPPPKKELSEQEQIAESFSFVQIHEHGMSTKDAPPPPPESFAPYAKKGEESGGVLAMLDLLVADLDKEMTEAETVEKDAQKEYESYMSDSAAKRAEDAKSLTDKESAKADLESDLQTAKEEKKSKGSELMATEEYKANLHADCDWLLDNFELRKSARAGEVESLKSAKAILAGADFSLVQKTAARRTLRRA